MSASTLLPKAESEKQIHRKDAKDAKILNFKDSKEQQRLLVHGITEALKTTNNLDIPQSDFVFNLLLPTGGDLPNG